jgi:amino acid adenylation domain-containing protein
MTNAYDRIAGLSPKQRALLRERLAAPRGAPAGIPRLPRDGRAFPLSFAQERMWFEHTWDAESPLYNQTVVLRITGPLDLDVLERAFNETVRRHEILRTRFTRVDGVPSQVILPFEPATLRVIDRQQLAPDARSAEIFRLAREQTERPFDVEDTPLYRLSVLRFAPDDYALILVIHHVVFDGWSGGVHFHELFTIYDAYKRGVPHALAELPIQYADYAAWQRAQASGLHFQRQLEYWKRTLAGVPFVLQLPTDRVRPAVRGIGGARHTLELDEPLTAALRQLAMRHDTTLFATLLTVLQTLLFRYTGQDDFLVGAPVTGRHRVELEPLIGLLINTVVIRARLDEFSRFRDLLGATRSISLEAFANAELPFERLVEELQPERDMGRTPLFQVFFDLQKFPKSPVPPPGLAVEAVRLGAATENFDLSLAVVEHPDKLVCHFGYRTDLFEAESIGRLASHFSAIARQAVSDPEARVSTYRLMDESECVGTLAVQRGRELSYAEDRCVHQLFHDRAVARPSAPALVADGRTLSYGELDSWSTRIALQLRGLGAGPETIVGICIERSMEWVAGLLGILKSGGAYASLDPMYPPDRLGYMFANTGARILLTRRGTRLPAGTDRAAVIYLDEPGLHGQVDCFDSGVTAENAAYVVYTSGSTGRPKGVVMRHGALLNLVHWHHATFDVGPDDRASQVARMGFDASAFEIWPYLTAGASVFIVGEETRYAPDQLAAFLIDNRITMGWLPPALGERLFQEPRVAEVPMRILFGGSDRATTRPPDTARFEYHNPYGPSETAVIVTCGPLRPRSRAYGPIDVGRPLANSQVYVLDPNMMPTPLGVPGEIYIGGASLARGYLHDAALTAEKFVPDPFANRPGSRLYRSGDQGRYLRDGTIEILGRLDHQVKIRGFRVELGEIEQALVEHPAVAEAVVLAHTAELGEKRLTAFVVPNPPTDATAAEQRQEHVRQWQELYDQTYASSDSADVEFDTVGWNNSYDGQPFSLEEMREWRDATIQRLLMLPHQRVLEIGCGTGLILFGLAPHASRYVATDFSPVSVQRIRNAVGLHDGLRHVSVLERYADDFEGIEPGGFDLVVLNSVIQYFPDAEYLHRVLAGAVRCLAAGGVLFIGDVRHLGQLAALQTSIQLARVADAADVTELAQRVQRGAAAEEELLVDPRYFALVRTTIPELVSAEPLLKRGRHANELTRFRYDVVLRKGRGVEQVASACLDWERDRVTVERIESLLGAGRPVDVYNVPNKRTAADAAAAVLLNCDELPGSVADLRERAAMLASGSLDPELFWDLAERYGFGVAISPSPQRAECFDAAFRAGHEGPPPPVAGEPVAVPQAQLTNLPRRRLDGDRLGAALRAHLELLLPEYMVPANFRFLTAMPLTANGKVDRRALQESCRFLARRACSEPPRTATEASIARIWAEALAVDRVGIDDNFFELGGHSLMVAQVLARMRSTLSVDLPIRALFESPTVAGLAARVEAARPAASVSDEMEVGEL